MYFPEPLSWYSGLMEPWYVSFEWKIIFTADRMILSLVFFKGRVGLEFWGGNTPGGEGGYC